MARRDDRQQAGMVGRDQPMRRGGDLLFAGMGAGGEPKRTRPDRPAQRRQRCRVGGERGGGRLQIADARHRGGAQLAEPLGLRRVLRQAKGEGLQQRAAPNRAGAASAPPSGPKGGR